MRDPSASAIRKAITKEELLRHCHRRTRGAELTLQLVEELLLQLSTATDSLGVPVLSERMVTIWEEERKHVQCIQDPLRVALYTITGHINKGGVELPVFRCARGTTSLELFHLHLARYVYTAVIACICTVTFSLDSSQALQQTIYITRGFCWRACPGGTRQEHWQLRSSSNIAS